MPLMDANLVSDLQDFLADVPESEVECAERWGSIMEAYVQTIVPASSTASAARAALVAGLSGMSVPGAALTIFTAAFASFGTALAGGMVPPGVPPASPFVMPISLTSDASVSSAAIGAAIGVWIRTGTSAPPASLPWT